MHISELDTHISRNKGCGTIDTLMKPFTLKNIQEKDMRIQCHHQHLENQ